MLSRLRAAVVGAAGVGKYHAQWYAAEGVDVVAFVGARPEAIPETATSLRRLLKLEVPGYASLDEMLAREQPDCVSVCTPPTAHLNPALACLQAGVQVLCEKPLVWGDHHNPSAILAAGQQMVTAAHKAGRLLAVNTQYVAAVEPITLLYERAIGPLDAITSLFFEMGSKGNRRGFNEYETIWVELGPHAISVLLALLPSGETAPGSLHASMERDRVSVRFVWESSDAPPCDVQFLLTCAREGQPVRRLAVNGFEVELGATRENDVFRATLRHGDQLLVWDDFMRVSLRRFAQAIRGMGEPLASADAGLRNLQLQLEVLRSLLGEPPATHEPPRPS
jgi:predicted dehydrogenase